MRNYWTPIFCDMLDSSVWCAHDPATRCVWIALLLMADADGYVGSSVPGIAKEARVSDEAARRALAIFESPDPDSRTPDHEGRRIEKVERGWVILNFVAMRERAKAMARKARQAAWARSKRAANDNAEPPPRVDGASTDVDASPGVAPQKRKQKLPSSEGGDTQPAVYRTLEGWQPSEALRAEATLAGVPDLDERIAQLRTGPIGGERGVLDRDEYVRAQLPKWRRWREQEQAKAQRGAQAPSGARFGAGGRVPVVLEPNARHEAFARKHGLDLALVVKGILDDDIPDRAGMHRARELIGERLGVAAWQKSKGRPATGKLTDEERGLRLLRRPAQEVVG